MESTLASEPWATWEPALTRFSAATGLVVSAWDHDGRRRLGPLVSSRLGATLIEASCWREGGAADELERGLALAAIAANADGTARVADQLHVGATPLRLFGVPYGAVTFGWVLADFASSLGTERLARLVGASARKLWSVARLETPVSERRLASYVALLATLIEAITQSREAISKLEELRATRALFLSHASHELRTPLNAIGLRIELLLGGALDDPAAIRIALEKMRRSAEEETRLVRDLLEAAVTTTGRFQLHTGPAELGAVVRAAYDAVAPVAETKGVVLAIEPAAAGDLPFVGDADRLQQALWNLVSNAVKFTPPGARVTLRVGADEAGYRIEVSDEGPGIDAAMVPHVFEPFTRRRDLNLGGLGLGLSIAKQIVELHGGDIAVAASAPGRGTTFVVTLPRPT